MFADRDGGSRCFRCSRGLSVGTAGEGLGLAPDLRALAPLPAPFRAIGGRLPNAPGTGDHEHKSDNHRTERRPQDPTERSAEEPPLRPTPDCDWSKTLRLEEPKAGASLARRRSSRSGSSHAPIISANGTEPLGNANSTARYRAPIVGGRGSSFDACWGRHQGKYEFAAVARVVGRGNATAANLIGGRS